VCHGTVDNPLAAEDAPLEAALERRRELSGICRSARGVTDTRDTYNAAPIDAIADDVRIVGNDLPHIRCRHEPPPMREVFQTTPTVEKMDRDVSRRLGVKLFKIKLDGLN
jgi:hypothetical protein